MASEILKVAKASYKEALKNKSLYSNKRNEILRRIINSEVPDWGNLKVIVSKI
jgi:hypothetical protein